ncbi:hypothetical protein [Methanosphaera sp. WGK6]|uniref:hypothetical protein n=1 Tax=Methanosphaera sp. WGK6 TaxID=1561964 RepID=UPI0013016FC9|nr:hypothetical protein [Methanosphaera sp. WGK6]
MVVSFLVEVFSSSFSVLFFFGLPGFLFGFVLVVLVLFSVLFFFGLPGFLFGFSGVSVVSFFGLPGFRLLSFSTVFLFLLFGGLPGPLFLGGSCFSIIVVVCFSLSSIFSSVFFVLRGLPGFLFGFVVFLFSVSLLISSLVVFSSVFVFCFYRFLRFYVVFRISFFVLVCLPSFHPPSIIFWW